jgi:biopolymer transport protein ExbD
MFKLPSKHNTEEVININLAPMIDIIFQLVIFFMCAMNFKSMDGKLLTYLPKDRSIPSNQLIQELEVIISLIYNKNDPMKPIIKIGDEILPDWNRLSQKVAIISNTYKNTNNPITFKIETHEQIPIQTMIDAINACKKSGIEPQLINKPAKQLK